MSIQSSINQTLGATAIAAKLSPQLQEFGEKIRTEDALHRTEGKIKKILHEGTPTWSTETGEHTGQILEDNQLGAYGILRKQQREQYYKALGLGANVNFEDFGSEPMSWNEAQQEEYMGLIQRDGVEDLKRTKEIMRDYQFGGIYYGDDEQ